MPKAVNRSGEERKVNRAKHTPKDQQRGSARASWGRRGVEIPSPCIEAWNSDLQSALVLIQGIELGTENGDLNTFTFSSLLDGAHALIERVSEDIDDWGRHEKDISS